MHSIDMSSYVYDKIHHVKGYTGFIDDTGKEINMIQGLCCGKCKVHVRTCKYMYVYRPLITCVLFNSLKIYIQILQIKGFLDMLVAYI